MPAEVTGLILAGGQGRRMSRDGTGCDKAWVEFGGEPLVVSALARLRPQVSSMMISANANLDRYLGLRATVHPDLMPGYPGPLAGIQTGLTACRTPWLVAVPCDVPRFPTDLVARLSAEASCTGARVAIARTGSGIHPVFMLLHRTTLPSLTAFLEAGQRRVRQWCESLQAISVDFDDDRAFDNLNTPEDLTAPERR